MSKEQVISLVYAGNDGVFDGMLISSLSVVKKTSCTLHVYILTMDLTEINEKFTPIKEKHRLFLENVLRSYNDDNRVILIDTHDLYIKYLVNSPNAKSAYTPYAMIRLFLDRIDIIPPKVLYLDTDTVASDDILPLFGTDTTGYEFAAVLDHYGKIFMGYHYINTGVLLLNLEQIRKTHLFDKSIKKLNKRRIFLPDQTVLNRKVKKKKLLERKYNEQKRYDRDDTVIQHFSKTIIWHPFFPFFYTKNIKPWNVDMVKSELTHKFDSLLDEYLILKKQFDSEAKND